MTNMQEVGIVPQWELRHRLQRARELTGLEQAEFAEELAVSRNSVSGAERGATRPREITLRAWAMRTGVSLEWLKYGHTSPGGDVVPPDGIEPSTYSLQGQRSGRVHILRPAA